MPDPRELLDRLDSRHNELIHKLDELNAQIEMALAQFGKSRGDAAPAPEAVVLPDRTASRRAA